MKALITAVLALALGTAPAAAQAQQQQQQQQQAAPQQQPAPRTWSQADLWDRGTEWITFRLGHISFPVTAGPTRLTRIVEASREGQGLDNALLYATPDEQVFVTVYVYAPGLPDAGLTAYMTDYAIRLLSGPEFRTLRSGVVAAGGREGVAIRTDYAGAREQRLASSAAFMRVGRWLVKIRVSGPEARRAEVERTMSVFLNEVRFQGRIAPAADGPITAPDCPRGPDRPARALAADSADTMEDTLMSVFLEGRGADDDERPAGGRPQRSATGWCRSAGFRLANMNGDTPVLRNPGAGTGDDSRRSVLFALIADNGTLLEVAERRFRNRTRYILIHHQIGRTMVLGAYDAVPTDAQLADILSGRDREGGRARARIDYQASGDSNVTLLVPITAPDTPSRRN